MEEFVKQSFTYANIRLYKNYSNINLKPAVEPEINIDDLLNMQFNRNNFHSLSLQTKDNKRRFFYTDNPFDSYTDHSRNGQPVILCEKIPIMRCGFGGLKNEYHLTTKDRQIKRHFNNPFAAIKIVKFERWIKREDDKITIKFYAGTRDRKINCKYFVRTAKSTSVVFNMKTGNFTIINYSHGKGIKRRSFYTNAFQSLKMAMGQIFVAQDKLSNDSPLFQCYMEKFDPTVFKLGIQKAFGFDIFGSPDYFNVQWIPKFAELRKIKIPDYGTDRFLTWYYPTEKYLKKNKRKLIASVLDRFEIKSDITVKLLHNYPNTNIIDIHKLCKLFGKTYPKYIGSINDYFFANNTIKNDLGVKESILEEINQPKFGYQVRDNEKENMVRIINDVCYNSQFTRTIVNDFYDHFRMLSNVQRYYPNMRLNCRTIGAFNLDHTDLSRIEQLIRTGYSTHLIFDSEVIMEIEKPIEVDYPPEMPIMQLEARKYEMEYVLITKRIFYPKLLKTSDEYSEEGHHMHHCVAGYINGANRSIIISLRCENDRVTCEFETRSGRNLQSRYMLNKQPPPYYEKALSALNERIRRISLPIRPIDKKEIPFVINGVQVKKVNKSAMLLDPFEV